MGIFGRRMRRVTDREHIFFGFPARTGSIAEGIDEQTLAFCILVLSPTNFAR